MAAVDAAGRTLAEAVPALYKVAMNRIMKNPDSTVRDVLRLFAQDLPDELLPVNTISTGSITPELAKSLLKKRITLGSDLADFSKDTRNIMLQKIARDKGVYPRNRYEPIFTKLDERAPMGSLERNANFEIAVNPNDLGSITKLIREMSLGSAVNRGFTEPKVLYRSLDLPWDVPSANRSGVLSLTETPENIVSLFDNPISSQSARNSTWIPQEVDPRGILYDFGIASKPRLAETEVQAYFGKPITGAPLSFEDMMTMRARQLRGEL